MLNAAIRQSSIKRYGTPQGSFVEPITVKELDHRGGNLTVKELDHGGGNLTVEEIDHGGGNLTVIELDHRGGNLSVKELAHWGGNLAVKELYHRRVNFIVTGLDHRVVYSQRTRPRRCQIFTRELDHNLTFTGLWSLSLIHISEPTRR